MVMTQRMKLMKSIILAFSLLIIPPSILFLAKDFQTSLLARHGYEQAAKIVDIWRQESPTCDPDRLSDVFKGRPALKTLIWGQDVTLMCLGEIRVVSVPVWQPFCADIVKISSKRGQTLYLNGEEVDGPVADEDCTGPLAIFFEPQPYAQAGFAQANQILREWREKDPVCDPEEAARLTASHADWKTSAWGGAVTLGCAQGTHVISFQVWPPICGDLIDIIRENDLSFFLDGMELDPKTVPKDCTGALAIIFPPEPYGEAGLEQAETILREWRALSPTCNSEETERLTATRKDWTESKWGGTIDLECARDSRVISFQAWQPVCEEFAAFLSDQDVFFLVNGLPDVDRDAIKDCTGKVAVIYPVRGGGASANRS
ncbi:hypothetical protein KAJ83_01310 [Marivibrio halodurans]|uniref:Uncharacterized protein n=1 Tax=Marivibrio halodurans TaxID=2039722 RepID=A0A8J7V0T3_9PROT|nr:hypothetical protein [Marivibrio halodurans]MBP5855630.1 hypothetical protein [Marivibrio halodurans]